MGGMEQVKVCTMCGVELPATREFFYGDPRARFGLQSRCKQCFCAVTRANKAAKIEEKRAQKRIYNRVYRAENREVIAARSALYRSTHRAALAAYNATWAAEHREERAATRRGCLARKAGVGGSHTASDIETQYERQKGLCFYCGVGVGNQYHVDHVVPMKLGGSNGPENLVVTCPACNLKKSSSHPMDWCGRML